MRGRVEDNPATALREHLIDTAETLLSSRQIAAVTIRDIARSAGVSDGVLYNYFADKNDLLLTALVRRYGRMVGRFEARLPPAGTATVEANLAGYALATLDLVADALPVMAGLITEPALLHRFVQEIHRQPLGPERVLAPVVDYLRAEERLGRLAGMDADAVATLLFGAAVVPAVAVLMGRQTHEDAARQVPVLVGALIRGLAPG